LIPNNDKALAIRGYVL